MKIRFLGLSLGTFLVIWYLACLALSIIVPDRGMHQAWLQLFVGFAWTPFGMFIGVVESFVFGLVTGIGVRADRKLLRDCSRRLSAAISATSYRAAHRVS